METSPQNVTRALISKSKSPFVCRGVCLLCIGVSVFWLYYTACGIFVPQPRIEPVSSALEAESQPPDHQRNPFFF